jgi:hypothetical protein
MIYIQIPHTGIRVTKVAFLEVETARSALIVLPVEHGLYIIKGEVIVAPDVFLD